MLTLGRIISGSLRSWGRSLRFIGLWMLIGFPLAVLAPDAPVPVAGLALLIAAWIWRVTSR